MLDGLEFRSYKEYFLMVFFMHTECTFSGIRRRNKTNYLYCVCSSGWKLYLVGDFTVNCAFYDKAANMHQTCGAVAVILFM